MQSLPALGAQAPYGPVERCGRQRRQQHPRHHTDQDERAFGHIRHDLAQFETHVEPGVGQQMQAYVEENEQANHAPQTGQRRPTGEFAQGRDGQYQHQKTQTPIAQ
ncbi:hypothetical protein FQZ97_1095590 [compost metagenome]